MVESKGASTGGHGALKGQHPFSWRDFMDIPVRWRQLSEPNDQVISVPADDPFCMLNLGVIGIHAYAIKPRPSACLQGKRGESALCSFAKACSCTHIM